MTQDLFDPHVMIAASMLLGLVILSSAALRAWNGWLALKERELDRKAHEPASGPHSGASRIEMADLRERIRKLEAIASGVDL